MLTYRTTREIQCVYVDGTSASLMDDGSMDAQMLLIHNNSGSIPDSPPFQTPPQQNDSYGRPPCGRLGRGSPSDNCTHWNPLQAEYDRAEGLCRFIKEKNLGGSGWGYEGIVRMNAAFELIWCDFSSPSVKLVSRLNTSSPLLDGIEKHRRPWSDEVTSYAIKSESFRSKVPTLYTKNDMMSSRWPDSDNPFQQYSLYQWFTAATRRYGFLGSVSGLGEAAEILYIIRPVIYAAAMAYWCQREDGRGKADWRPWLLGLSIEYGARQLAKHDLETRRPGGARGMTQLEREELKKRSWALGWWAMRGAFYQNLTRVAIQGFTSKLKNKPILDMIGNIIDDYEFLWDQYYFPTATL
jgi:hypothetical protein